MDEAYTASIRFGQVLTRTGLNALPVRDSDTTVFLS
jgi:hypothetical protein